MPAMIAEGRVSPSALARRHWCLVLAAGGSRRLGRRKQLVRLGGEPLVRRAVRAALATRPLGVRVVVGAAADAIAAQLRGLPVEIVRNPRWRTGLASSLRAGLARPPAHGAGTLVLTVDQWAVRVADLRRLVTTSSGGRTLAAAEYAGHAGVPAMLPRATWAQLRRLSGDRGARAILARPGVRRVPIPAAALDLDTPAELRRLRSSSMPRRNAAARRAPG
ncbi:MAG: nucleotidyltransferase family protein [Steroidobacteraceae bacterium]|nr:nucleotidyltransferase family protein [Steroidobacteraceae bacterium]